MYRFHQIPTPQPRCVWGRVGGPGDVSHSMAQLDPRARLAKMFIENGAAGIHIEVRRWRWLSSAGSAGESLPQLWGCIRLDLLQMKVGDTSVA